MPRQGSAATHVTAESSSAHVLLLRSFAACLCSFAAKIRRCAQAGCLAAVSSSAYRIPGNEMWTQWEGAAPSGLSSTEAEQYHLTVPFVHVGREDARLIRDALSDREEYVSAVIKAEAARLAAASSTGAGYGGAFGANSAVASGSDSSPSATTLAASAPRSGSVDEIIGGTHGIGSSTIGTSVDGSSSSLSASQGLSAMAVSHLNLSRLSDVVNFHVYLSSTDSSNPWKDAYTSLYFVIFFQVMLGSLHLLVTLVCIAKIKRFWKLRTVRPMYAWVPILCLSLLGLANLERGLYCCLDPMGATHHLPRGYRRVMLSLSVPWTYASTLLLTFFWAEAIQRKRAAGSYLTAATTTAATAHGARNGESPMAPHSPTTGVVCGGGGDRGACRLLPVAATGRLGDPVLDVCTAPSEKSSGLGLHAQQSSGPQPMSAHQLKQMQAARNAALKRLAARSAAAAVEAQRRAEREQALAQHPAHGASPRSGGAALPAALDCDGLELAAMRSPLALTSSADAACGACSSPISAADPSTQQATQALLPKPQQQSLQSPHKLAVTTTAAATPLVRKSKSAAAASASSPAAHSSAKHKLAQKPKPAPKASKASKPPPSAKRSPPRRRAIGGAGEFDEPFHLRIAGEASDASDGEDADEHDQQEEDDEDEQATNTYADSPYMHDHDDDGRSEYSRSRSHMPFKHAQRMRRAAQEEEIAGAVDNIGQAAAMSSARATTRAPPAHSHVTMATHLAALRIHVPAGSGSASPMPLPPPPAQPPATPAPLLVGGDASPMHRSFLQPQLQSGKHAALAMQMHRGSLMDGTEGQVAAGDAMPRSSSYVGLQSVPLYAHLAGDAIVAPTGPASPVSPASLCSTPQVLPMGDAAATAGDMQYRIMPAAAAVSASASPRGILKQKLAPLQLHLPAELEMAPLKQRMPAAPASPSAVSFPIPAAAGSSRSSFSSSSSSKLTPPPPFLVSYQYAFLLAFLFLVGLDLSFSVLDAQYILDWQLLPVVELVFALIGVVITAMYFLVAAQVLRRLREEGEIKLAAAEYNQARASEEQQAITRQGGYDDLHEWSARMLGVHRHSLAHAPSAAGALGAGAAAAAGGAGGDDHVCSPLAPHSPVQHAGAPAALRTARSSPALATLGQQAAPQHAHARMHRHLHAQRRPLDIAGTGAHDPHSPYVRAPSSPQGPAASAAHYTYPVPPFPARAPAAGQAQAGRSRAAAAVPSAVVSGAATTTLASHHAAVLASLRASHHAKMVRMWQFIVGSGLGLLLFLAVTLASPQLWHEQMHSTLDDPITTICRDFLLFLALFIVGACQVGAF